MNSVSLINRYQVVREIERLLECTDLEAEEYADIIMRETAPAKLTLLLDTFSDEIIRPRLQDMGVL